MGKHPKSVSWWLAIMIGILPTVVAAQEANGLIVQGHDIIRLVVDNALIGLGLFLGLVLALGMSLDFYRSLRARRAGAGEELE